MADEVLDRGAASRALAWTRQLPRAVVAALVSRQPDPLGPTRYAVRVRGSGRIPLVVVADVVAAATLAVLTASGLQPLNTAAGSPYSNEFVLLVTALSTAPAAARSLWPLAAWRTAVAALVLASTPVAHLMGQPVAPGGIAMFALCAYSVAARSGRLVTTGAWLVSVAALAATQVRGLGGGVGTVALGAGLIAVPLLWGHNVRERRRAQSEVADHRRRVEEERAARAVLQERSRIARELHDVVAHHMSVIAVQAEAAPLRNPDVPEELRDDLATIRQTALQAMTEMRRVLGVLRQDEDAESEPQPGLDHVPELIKNARTAGLDVTLTLMLDGCEVPPGVSVSIYRILQESLSNALRHAPGAAVDVDVRALADPPRVRVHVENGPPTEPTATPAGGRGGHGLVGMRERAAMLGGELTAGPTPDGGFAVTATLPLEQP